MVRWMMGLKPRNQAHMRQHCTASKIEREHLRWTTVGHRYSTYHTDLWKEAFKDTRSHATVITGLVIKITYVPKHCVSFSTTCLSASSTQSLISAKPHSNQRPMLAADWRRTIYHTLHYLLLTEDTYLPWKLDPKVACKFSQWQSASDSTLVWDSGAAMQHNGEIATNPAQSGTTFMDIKQLALQKETTP